MAVLTERRRKTFVFFRSTLKNSVSVQGSSLIKDFSSFVSVSGSGFLGLSARGFQVQQQIDARLSLKIFRRAALRHGHAEQDCTAINSRCQSILNF